MDKICLCKEVCFLETREYSTDLVEGIKEDNVCIEDIPGLSTDPSTVVRTFEDDEILL